MIFFAFEVWMRAYHMHEDFAQMLYEMIARLKVVKTARMKVLWTFCILFLCSAALRSCYETSDAASKSPSDDGNSQYLVLSSRQSIIISPYLVTRTPKKPHPSTQFQTE